MGLFFSQRDPRGKLVAQAVFLFLLFFIHPFCVAQKGPARLVLTPKDQILQIGQQSQLLARRAFLGGVPAMGTFAGTVTPVSWFSSDSTVASVNPGTGLVTPASAGIAVISAVSGPLRGSTRVIVTDNPLSTVCISPFSATVVAGLTQKFNATGLFGSGNCPGTTDITSSVAWSSADTGTATVSNAAGTEGLATGIKQGGPVTITAAYGGITASASLTVNPPVLLAIMVTPNPANIPNVGGTLTLTAVGNYTDAARPLPNALTPSISWVSSKPSIATVSSNGLATAIAQNTTTITATDLATAISGSTSLTVGPNNALTFYVSLNGNDSLNGTLPVTSGNNVDGPFATLDHARSVLQSLNKTGLTQVFVQFRSGTYFLSAPVQFSSADSGSPGVAIVYENYPNETPVISGGVQITNWTNTSGNTWNVSLDPAKYQYFEQLFFNGERRFRPRANGGTYLRNAGPVYVGSRSPSCNIQVGNQWECFDRFYYKPGDINPNWSNLNSPAGDIEIDDFEKWTMAKMRLQSVDDVNHIAYLTGSTAQDALNHGFINGHRYLVENVKDVLNQPGEWFLDRSAAPWTLTYLAQIGEDLNSAQVIVPQSPQLVVANNLSYVAFKGLTFSHDNWVVPAAGHLSVQAEPSVTAAVSFTNSSNITFDSDIIAHTGGWGIDFVGDNTASSASNQVLNSMLYDIGTGGVRIGKTVNKSDTDANVPQFNTVQNNVVAGFGRVLPAGTGTGIWIGDSHDNLVTHNEVFDGYNGGIGVCVPTAASCQGLSNSEGAFNNVISYNLVYQLGLGVTDDMGCIYLATEAATGNKVLNNRCHDVMHATEDPDGYGGNGIYIDSTTHGVLVQNNLVYRVSQAGLQNTIGAQSPTDAPNIIQNNIFAYSLQGALVHGGGSPVPTLYFSFHNNLVYFDKGGIQKRGYWYCWNTSCSSIYDFASNAYWNTNGGLATLPNAFFVTNANGGIIQNYSFAGWQGIGEDPGGVVADPHFANPTYPADDFSLKDTSVADQVGFVPFDTNAPGRTSKVLNPPAVPAGFPLTLLNPATDY